VADAGPRGSTSFSHMPAVPGLLVLSALAQCAAAKKCSGEVILQKNVIQDDLLGGRCVLHHCISPYAWHSTDDTG
jgi:hypothetical protein